MRQLFTIALFQAALLVPALSYADQDVTLEQLPPAVRATVDQETKGGVIKDIERDDKAGQVTYEVEFTLDGKAYELDIAEDGKVIQKRLD